MADPPAGAPALDGLALAGGPGAPTVVTVLGLLALAGAVLAAAGLRRRYVLVRVRGSSMAPTYSDGDLLLARRGRRYRRGQVVVFTHPLRTLPTDPSALVKRVRAVAGDDVPADLRPVVATTVVPVGKLLVRGDNPASLDSRRLGLVPEASVSAVVLRRIRAASDAGG